MGMPLNVSVSGPDWHVRLLPLLLLLSVLSDHVLLLLLPLTLPHPPTLPPVAKHRRSIGARRAAIEDLQSKRRWVLLGC